MAQYGGANSLINRVKRRYKGVSAGEVLLRGGIAAAATTATVGTLGMAGVFGAHLASKRFKGPSALKLIRAAQVEFPNLKRNLQISRPKAAWSSGGGAAYDLQRSYQPGSGSSGVQMREMVGSVYGLKTKSSRKAGIIIGKSKSVKVAGPMIAHEVGHLRSTTTIGNRTTVMDPTSMARFKEEARATWQGRKVWQRAGGNMAQYWATMGPALATYGAQNKAIIGTVATIGAATSGNKKSKRKRKK